MLELNDYLKPTQYIDSLDARIVHQANDLMKFCPDKEQTVDRFFHFVRDRIIFDAETKKVPDRASEVLVLGRGNSTGKACLLSALCRAVKIPAGIQFQQVKDLKRIKSDSSLLPSELIWHAVAKVCLEGRWIKLDASFDRWLAIGRETDAVNFDGIHDALVPQRDWHEHQNYEIMEESQLFIDIPTCFSTFN